MWHRRSCLHISLYVTRDYFVHFILLSQINAQSDLRLYFKISTYFYFSSFFYIFFLLSPHLILVGYISSQNTLNSSVFTTGKKTCIENRNNKKTQMHHEISAAARIPPSRKKKQRNKIRWNSSGYIAAI